MAIIRDIRRKEMFRLDDEYLNGYARLCGISATGVYMSLCRHANKSEQACWPSIELISEELAISRDTVMRAIKKLEKWNIITVIRERDEKTKRQKVNIYVLMDKSSWNEKPSSTTRTGAGSQLQAEPGSNYPPKPGSTTSMEGNTLKVTHRRGESPLREEESELGFIKTC